MSVRATSWAWDRGLAGHVSGGELLTLLRVADHADNDGVCWPGEKSLAEYTSQGETTVRGHLRSLESRGFLNREKQQAAKGRGRFYDRILLAIDQPADSGGNRSTTNRQLTDDQPAADAGGTNKGTVKNRQKVNGKTVSEDEYTLAAAVVSSFNEVAGTAFSVDANLTPVVMRIRQRPDLTAANHRFLIKAVFAAEHWWTDPAGIEIVYGNAKIFEKSIELARAAARKPASSAVDVNAEMDRVRREQGLDT